MHEARYGPGVAKARLLVVEQRLKELALQINVDQYNADKQAVRMNSQRRWWDDLIGREKAVVSADWPRLSALVEELEKLNMEKESLEIHLVVVESARREYEEAVKQRNLRETKNRGQRLES
jgi:hypothetical protein